MEDNLSLTGIQPKNFLQRQHFQFFLIGSVNAIINLGFLNILLLIWPTTNETKLIIFNTGAYLLSIVNSYFWNSRVAFRHHARKDLREKVDFSIQAGVILIISNLTFLGGMHFLALFRLSVWLIQNISKLFAMVTPSIANFFSMKYFVFRRAETA
jgi:putative flippase GtrA